MADRPLAEVARGALFCVYHVKWHIQALLILLVPTTLNLQLFEKSAKFKRDTLGTLDLNKQPCCHINISAV